MNNVKKHAGMKPVAATAQQIEQVKQKLIADQFDGKFQQRLKAEQFPTDLSGGWYFTAMKSLRHESPLSLGVSAEEFRALVVLVKDSRLPDMYQFSILSNSMESKSVEQLGVGVDAYLDMIDEVGEMAKLWNEKSGILRDEVIDEIGTALNLKEATPEQPVGSFPVAKGEA